MHNLLNPTEAAHGSLRILLAEDELASQRLMHLLLTDLGHTVDLVADGVAALAALGQRTYDVILLDLHMPALDGVAVAQTLVHLPTRPYVIALTGSALAVDGAQLDALGLDDYLQKPIEQPALVAALARGATRHAQHTSATPPPSATGGPAAAARPALDPQTRAQTFALLGGVAERWQSVIELYLRDATLLVDQIATASSASDWAALARAAHQLKSGSALVGALTLAHLCDELETDARAGMAIDPARISALAAEYERVAAALGKS